MAEALSPLVPEENRTALTLASDRIAIPAPDGPQTLVQVLSHLAAAHIELLDIALRRPSLEEVFLALTIDTTGDTSATRPGQHVAAGSGQPAGGRHRVRANGRATRLDAEALS